MDTVKILIRAGISRDARTKLDRTSLHLAAQEGHLVIVDFLLRSGADIDARDMVIKIDLLLLLVKLKYLCFLFKICNRNN